MDNTSKARLNGCHPAVIARIEQLEQILGFELEVVQGNRSFALQGVLFAQGREPLDSVNTQRAAIGLAPISEEENHIVTKAQPGYGWHEYGMAGDVCPFDPNHKLDWNVNHPNWQKILAAAPTVGLAEGAQWRTFPDNPHLYPQELPASPGDDIREAYASGGKEAVWGIVPVSP